MKEVLVIGAEEGLRFFFIFLPGLVPGFFVIICYRNYESTNPKYDLPIVPRR